MEHYNATRLYYLKDELRFREMYTTILAVAKLGQKQKVFQMHSDDNITYITEQLRYHFPDVKIENGNLSILVNWDKE